MKTQKLKSIQNNFPVSVNHSTTIPIVRENITIWKYFYDSEWINEKFTFNCNRSMKFHSFTFSFTISLLLSKLQTERFLRINTYQSLIWFLRIIAQYAISWDVGYVLKKRRHSGKGGQKLLKNLDVLKKFFFYLIGSSIKNVLL